MTESGSSRRDTHPAADGGAIDPLRFRFVLVGPQGPRNVGAACRALKNLGFRHLTLVAPECDPKDVEARRAAMDGADVLRAARVVDDLDRALEGATTVVGTSRRQGKQRRPHWRLDVLAPRLLRLAHRGDTVLLFGREDKGLTDDELDRCTHLVHLLSSDVSPSFNLAQSVLLVAYELCRASEPAPEPAIEDAPAEHGTREAMYRHLEAALRAIGFLKEDSAAVMMRRLRRMMGRAELTTGDVHVLRGIARQTLWLAREAGLEGPDEETLQRLDAEARGTVPEDGGQG